MTVKCLKKHHDLIVCSWNVRSLVENTGDIRICRKQCFGGDLLCDSVDRKLDLLVGELQHYKVSVAGIQETKWFGAYVWPATCGYTMLHSGTGAVDVVAQREGVGIVLDKRTIAAWRSAGE